ncbi:MAG: site-2 protease family protein, partial [Muribaculaceae bacterium]|nr:site-2 protease family protein [Muribaculaceae bacterium]
METFLIKALQLIAALSLLVLVHEFGHYLFSRIFGIKVEKFYLFFNPWFTPFKWKPKPPKKRKLNPDGTPKASWRDTEYGIGWLPLGGYCKIAGMIDESMDKEQMAQPAKADEFRSRPAYQRLLVMVGGVMFNFILAIIIYIGIAWYWGDKYVPYENATAGMLFTDAAKAAGYQDGDIILSADGHYVSANESP